MREPQALVTSLSFTECQLRLGVLRTPPKLFAVPDAPRFIGRVHGEGLRVSFVQGIRSTPSVWVFVGRMIPCAEGTRIVGGFRLALFMRFFLAAWFLGLAVMGGTFAWGGIRALSASRGSDALVLLSVGAILLALAWGVTRLERAVSIPEAPVILAYLRERLDARGSPTSI